MKKFLDSIAKWIIVNCNTEMDYDEIYFALNTMFSTTLHLFTIIIISLIFNQLISGMVFSILYMLLRSYAGGVHMDTSAKCYFVSLAMFIFIMFLIRSGYIVKYIEIFEYIAFPVASVVIIILAPIDNENKRLDAIEKKYYKKISRIIILAYVCLLILALSFKFYSMASVIIITVILESILVIIGKILNSLN